MQREALSHQFLECFQKNVDHCDSVEVIYLEFQETFSVDIIYMDSQKVPHQRILNTLSYHGIRGHIVLWIKIG